MAIFFPLILMGKHLLSYRTPLEAEKCPVPFSSFRQFCQLPKPLNTSLKTCCLLKEMKSIRLDVFRADPHSSLASVWLTQGFPLALVIVTLMEKFFEVDQNMICQQKDDKTLNWKNIKKQGLKLTSSHVTFVFDFHFRAGSWWRLLVGSCVLSSAPSLPDLSSITWAGSCSLKEGCQRSQELVREASLKTWPWCTASSPGPHRK